MHLYPIFLSLAGRRVVVAGAGSVGKRKIAGLLDALPAAVLVFDPALSAADERALAASPCIRVFRRALVAEDVAGCALAFAATGCAEENRRVLAVCETAGVPCNVADDPEGSAFHVPAQARVGDLAAAFSTGGKSPALAARIRRDAAIWLEENYAPLAVFMGRLRPLLTAESDCPGKRREKMFRTLVNSCLGDALRRKDGASARQIVRSLLPVSLHGHIEDLFHGLC